MSLGLTNDFIFKYVFGQEDNSPHLLALVNAVLEDSGFKPVITLVIKNPVELKDADWLKSSTLDIKAKDESGREYDIEIQVTNEPNFKNRSLYYWSKAYSNQLIKGDYYIELKGVICINIVDFVLFKNLSEFHTCFMLIDKKIPDTVLSEDLQIHFVELPKAQKFSGKLAELAQLIEKASPELEEEMTVLLQKDPLYQEVYNRYEHCLEDETTRDRALSREKFERDMGSRLYSSFTEGKLEGKLETARKLLHANKLNLQEIADVTGLSVSEVGDL